MFGFIKRLVADRPVARINDDPFGRDAKPLPQAAETFTAPSTEAPPIVVHREEIIDAKTRIGGYRFSVHIPDSRLEPNARVTREALRSNNVAAFAERRMALIPLPAAYWLSIDFQPLIGPHTVILLDPPGKSLPQERWREVAQAIRAAGAGVAVTETGIADDRRLIFDCADFLLIDFSAYPLAGFERALTVLKTDFPKLQLVVENVGGWPERRLCVSFGVAYCLGPFTTAADEDQQSGEISQSRIVLIEMLNLLRRDADLADIVAVAKRDPGVAVKVVAMANSPIVALDNPVGGIDQAIMMLGREQLYRWLSLAMFRAGANSPRDEVLLELALARGRFLELVGQEKYGKRECDELFLVGLLSLLDSLLGVPMAKVVERLHLSAEMKDVLLNSAGPIGRYLMLAIAVEKGGVEQICRLAQQTVISIEGIEKASAAAREWAEHAVRLSQ
jgi:EAL and modified HD-GYP domain-containing signal transduction protein